MKSSHLFRPLAFSLVGLFCFSQFSHAQSYRELKKHSIGIGLGQNFLLGDYSSHGEDQITMDLFYSYSASYSFDLLVNGHVSSHEFKDEKVDLLGLAVDVKARLFDYDQFAPFVMGGLGFYSPQTTRRIGNRLVESDRKLTFGVNAGAGADLHLNEKSTVGLLLHFHRPFNVKQENQPTVSGGYAKLLITYAYTF